MLHFYWSLEREAVVDERSGSFALGTLIIWVGSLASDGCWVALWNAEFLLAQRSSGVTGVAERGAQFSLAERRFLLLLLLRNFLGCGEARGAPEDALMSMADAGVSLVCTGVSGEFTGVLLE